MTEALGSCGRFTLVRKIGAGGMGEIFLAEGPDGRPVAIKRLPAEGAKDPLFAGMFLDEARLVSRMRHPNVCEVHEHGMEGLNYFLAMEHIDGKSLAELLKEHDRLPAGLACRVIAEVAAGLDYAHRLTDEAGEPLGIVHRDVSPANIMVRADGVVKLVDFGLAKARTQLMKTLPGLVKGKFGYLAPEQLGGTIDWRTDVFALGLCLYEALAGRPLFNQRTAAETVQAIRSFTGPPALTGVVPDVTHELDAVLARALAPTPSRRFESAAAVRVALAEVVRAMPPESVSPERLAALVRGAPTPREPASLDSIERVRPSRLGWIVAAAVGLVLAAAATAWWLV